MSGCTNCSDSGSSQLNCPNYSGDVTWNGGALCTGFSSGDLNDALQHLANQICDINTTIAAGIAATSDDITLSTLAGSCFTATTGSLLTAWIDEAEAKICALITLTTAYDFTEPVDVNNTPVTVTNQVAYQTLDTITIPANTLNENNEYLEVDLFVSTSVGATANSLLKITFAGVDAVIWNMLGTVDNPGNKAGLRATVRFTRLTSNTLAVDWNGVFKQDKNIPVSDYGIEANITPLDFTVSNAITIEGHRDTGTMTMSRTTTTKYVLH